VLRPLGYIFISSIGATLFGAWMAAWGFAGTAPFIILLALGGIIAGAGYVLILFLAAQFFPGTFFAAFPIRPRKA
jgi:hypothetical protein